MNDERKKEIKKEEKYSGNKKMKFRSPPSYGGALMRCVQPLLLCDNEAALWGKA